MKTSDHPPSPPIIDPTANVLKLVEKAVERMDDLRLADERRQDDLRAAESRRVDEQAALRAFYDEQLRDAEAKRIDAIRAVDVSAVAIQNERAVQQAAVLANQVTASKDTLQALVASTADQLAKSVITPLADRVSALEKAERFIGGRDIQRDAGKIDIAKYVGWLLALAAMAWAVFGK